MRVREARARDLLWLLVMGTGLAALVIALKQAPERGWTSGVVLGLLTLSVASTAGFARRTLRAPAPIVDLSTFADRRFAIGCVLSFVLGIGLFGSVYLMPVFLAFVRGHDALEIGTVMLVTGIAQLLMAPVAVALEQRANARLLTAAGFGLFALGLGMSAFQTPETDFDGMFWPQVVRGLAIMFCLLPPTRLALGHLDAARVPDASGVFNLIRFDNAYCPPRSAYRAGCRCLPRVGRRARIAGQTAIRSIRLGPHGFTHSARRAAGPN